MKRNLLILLLVLAIAVGIGKNIYAQAPKDTNMLSEFNYYRISPLQINQQASLFSSSFLNSVNVTPAPYLDTPVDKMGVGVINASTSWAQIPKEITDMSEQYNIFLGCTVGFGKGLVTGFGRGIAGVIDMITFGMPPYDEPSVKPDYKVDNPDKDGFKITFFRW